jgi:hypothetical protein
LKIKNTKILWFVSTLEDVAFLKSFNKSFSGEIKVVHLNFITRLALILSRITSFTIWAWYKDSVQIPKLDRSFNYLSGRLSIFECEKAYQNTYGFLEQRTEQLSEYIIMIPSGRHVHHIAATDFAKKNCIKTIYINYSNFPGYTFFDPQGTDCASSIYAKPGKLDLLFPCQLDIEKVFSKFNTLKIEQKNIPQATTSHRVNQIKNMLFLIDTFIQKITGVVGDRRITKTKVELDATFDFDSVVVGESFVFFPMQVSTDQQVLVNYSGGSIEQAIEEAVVYAQSIGKALYIKEHPAEGCKNKIRAVLNEVRSKHVGVRVVNDEVPLLISKSDEVITINSTVGLECRLAGKKVVFLGKSFYDICSDQQLAKYLECYFITVDYHSPVINEYSVLNILRMAE